MTERESRYPVSFNSPDASIGAMSKHLLSADDWSLYLAYYDHLSPGFRNYLALSRERCFREAGEGTGMQADCDRFDPHYAHLILWDHGENRIVGGYRIANADTVRRHQGLEGLYSHSLFHYSEDLLAVMGRPVELGRSFIMPVYQRNPRALDMLWRGIGQVALAWSATMLFGCVSVSSRYDAASRDLIRQALLQNNPFSLPGNCAPVEPRYPLNDTEPYPAGLLASLGSTRALNELLLQHESQCQLPVLIRQYLNLGAEFFAFTRNPGFSDTMDGLMAVDLGRMPARYKRRFLQPLSTEGR